MPDNTLAADQPIVKVSLPGGFHHVPAQLVRWRTKAAVDIPGGINDDNAAQPLAARQWQGHHRDECRAPPDQPDQGRRALTGGPPVRMLRRGPAMGAAMSPRRTPVAQLVSPRQMPELLRNFFEKSDRLTLLALDKLPVKPAFKQVANNGSNNQSAQNNDSNTGNKSDTTGSQKISFYRHDFTVTLRGKYFELLKSLQTLESMNIKIYWDSLDYQVENYPNADIKLTLYTYSYDKNWIGA